MRVCILFDLPTATLINLMSPILRRLFLVCLPSLTASNSLAGQSAWSCQQDKNTNEWVCLDQTNPPVQANPEAAEVAGENLNPIANPEAPAPITASEPPSAKPVAAKKPAPRPEALAPAEPAMTPTAQPEAIAPPKPVAVTAKPSAPASPTTEAAGASAPVTATPTTTGTDTVAASAKPDFQPCDSDPDCYKATDEEEPSDFRFRLLSPVFDPQQEKILHSLAGQFPKDPWANCMATTGSQKNVSPANRLRDRFPMDVKSNYSEIFDNEIGYYAGNVVMARADQHAQSHAANYDSVSETLDLQGDVYYSDNELALHSNSASLKLGSDQAKSRDSLFIYPATPLRGYAKAIYRDSKDLSHYQDVVYSTCRPGNQDWALHASELKLDKIKGKGAVKNAWVEFKGTPIFYSPFLSFPIDNRRISGFLAPSFGSTQLGGFNLSTPYYWNLAPNYDILLTPKYFSKRGYLMGGNSRYMTEQSRGRFIFEYMPDDAILHHARYQGSFKNTTQFTPNINSNLDLNYVSDKNYFAELGNALNYPNYSFIRSQADVNYVAENINFKARVENYQTIDPALTGIQVPYRRLPQINLNLSHSFRNVSPADLPLNVQLDSEAVYFQHDTLVNAQRYNARPSISLPLQTASAYLTPKVSVQQTNYTLTNQPSNAMLASQPANYLLSNEPSNSPQSISRTVPTFSADTGLFLERNFQFADKALVHTLEPRLFYLYTPYVNQNNIPLFDSSIYDLWYSAMFRENRFSGSDRIQDANQVTAAISSRVVDPETGNDLLKLNVGEIFYFRNRNVTLCGNYPSALCAVSPVETEPTSPLVAELSSQINRHVGFDSGIQWDYHTNKIVRGKATIHLVRKPGEVINFGYLYRLNPLVPNHTNDITQSDMSLHWPITNGWSLVGRWQYSWLYNRTQDGFVGLEKENCCWRFRVIAREYLSSIYTTTSSDVLSNNTVQGTSSTGIFFQIELKGLTGFGEQLDTFFAKSIYGYRKPGQ